MTIFKLNVFKLSLLTSLVGLSGYANATVSGSSDLAITGSLNGSNQCTIAIDNGAAIDAGVHHIADLPSEGGLLPVGYIQFNPTINCVFPTAIAVKFSSSLANGPSHTLGNYMTSTNKQVGHLYGRFNIPPTAGGVEYIYATVGHLDLSTISGSDTFTSRGDGSISSHIGHYRNAYSVVDSNSNPIASTAFVLPFLLGVLTSNKSSGWADDVADGIFSMNATITFELHAI